MLFFSHLSSDLKHKQYFGKIASKWEPQSDVFAIRFGTVALTGFASYTGFWATRHLRLVIQMRDVMRLASFAPACYIGVFASLAHVGFIQLPMISGRVQCPLCLYTRSAIIQATFGVLIPTVVASTSVAYFAHATNSYAFGPKMFTEWSSTKITYNRILDLFKVRQGDRRIAILLVVNAILGYYLAYEEQRCLYIVGAKLEEQGKRFTVDSDVWNPMQGIKSW